MTTALSSSAFTFPTVIAVALKGDGREANEAGYWDGYTDRQPEIDQADADADRYYRAAFNRGPRPRPHPMR